MVLHCFCESESFRHDLQPDDTVTLWKERLCSPRTLRLLRTQAAHAAPRPADPGRDCQTSGALVQPPPPASSRSGNISCPRPHPQLPGGSELASQPGQRSQLPQLDSQPTLAGEVPVWLRKPKGEPRRREQSQVVREPQCSGKTGANWRRAGTLLPFVTCSLAGVSRSSRPLPALSSHAVAHAGFSAGPHAPGTEDGRLLHAAAPNRRVPGSTAPAARHRELLDLPWGARCPTPASPQTLRARGEGGGQARGARDSARPETSRLEGRREGADTAAATPGSLAVPSWGRPPGACQSPT